MALEIITVETKKQRLEFIKMAWKIYRDYSHWVPPIIADQKEFLDPKRGVFFGHGQARLFLARRAGEVVGRISAHVNSLYDEKYQDEKGFFGFFECEDNQETADALFKAAEDYLRSKGKKIIEGPLSFGVYDEIGILIDSFDLDPYILTVYNPPYYPVLIEKAGLEKSIDWFAYRGKTDSPVDEKLFRVRQRVLEKVGLTVRTMEMKQLEREAGIIKDIWHNAWNQNWGDVPVSEREFKRLIAESKKIVVFDLRFIAEVDGRPVGFALSFYDANVAVKTINGRLFPFGFIKLLRNIKKTDRFRHVLMGVLDEYRNRAIEITFYTAIAENAYRLGFREVELSVIVENNQSMNRSLKHLPVEVYRTYRIYKKELH